LLKLVFLGDFGVFAGFYAFLRLGLFWYILAFSLMQAPGLADE